MSSVAHLSAQAPAGAPQEADAAHPFGLTLWTDDPRLAARADAAGVDRIGLDLETLHKAARQAGLNTWISGHRVERLPEIRRVLSGAELFARVNCLWAGSRAEVELLLGHGVGVLMLPMFASAEELSAFIDMVDGRASVVPLLETPAAVADLERIVALDGLEEIHVGINDLALAMGLRNRFELLESPELDSVARTVLAAGLRLGIGGIGRLDAVGLPIPPDLLYAQYARLGARAALLSRGYLAGLAGARAMRRQVSRSRARMGFWQSAPPELAEQARREFNVALERAEVW